VDVSLRIREIAQTRVRYGYRKIRVLLNREGWQVGKYLVERIYREEGLTLRQRRKRRRRVAEHRRERFHPRDRIHAAAEIIVNRALKTAREALHRSESGIVRLQIRKGSKAALADGLIAIYSRHGGHI